MICEFCLGGCRDTKSSYRKEARPRAAGCRIAIWLLDWLDGFGVNYAGLELLVRLQPDLI